MTVQDESRGDQSGGGGNKLSPELPPIDFSTFVLSLSTGALYQMGLVDSPDGEASPVEPDLMSAQQSIETLKMLRAKTAGNLDRDEMSLLDSLLYELHTRFAELEKGRK